MAIKTARARWIGGLLLFLCAQLSVSADEQQFVETLERVKGGVVAVGTFNPMRAPRAEFRGTGFAISDGRLVVTNAHVLPEKLSAEKNEKLAVFIRQQNTEMMFAATEVAADKEHDLAVLKLEEGQLSALKLAPQHPVKEGQSYAFTGYPLGMVLGIYPVTHRAMISAISPDVIPMINAKQLSDTKLLKRLQQPFMVFQLDATAYPGNSGSPLYHPETGEVIGVINKVFVQESKEAAITKPSGITYAIPVEYLKRLLDEKKLI